MVVGKSPPVERNQKFRLVGEFFSSWSEPEEEWFWWFEPFSKLKTAFCEYWTSLKIKISMTCVSKEYKIKTKMIQKQRLHLKMTFLLGCSFKIVKLLFNGERGREIKIWWGWWWCTYRDRSSIRHQKPVT